MSNHLGAGITMGAAIGSLGVLLNDFLEAREEENLLRKVEKYERLQDLMVKRLEFFQRYVQQVEKNLSIAEEVIAKYKNEAIPSWEEGVKGLGNQIAQLQTEKAAAEQQLASLKLELAKSKDQVEDLQGLYQASLRMAQDLKQGGEEAQSKASAAESQIAKLQQELDRKTKSLDTYRAWHAANLSLRCALEMQLLRADPENPLLHDQELRERVRRAGEMAVTMLGDNPDVDPFDMAREAGLTFDVPGRPSGVQVLSELALTEVYMRRLAFLNADGEAALGALQKVQLGHGAMSAARDLLKEMDPQSALLQASTVRQVQDLAMEEFQRQQQQRRLSQKSLSNHWDRSEVGHQHVIQRTIDILDQ